MDPNDYRNDDGGARADGPSVDEDEALEQERRRGERRRWTGKAAFPLVDSEGTLVTGNRRRVVDRRIGLKPRRRPATGSRRLMLELAGQRHELGPARPLLLVGRGETCHLRLDEQYVSREHARIVYRDGVFLIIDYSSNGTSLRTDAGEVLTIHGSERILSGSGVIRFGHLIDDGARDLVRYSCLL